MISYIIYFAITIGILVFVHEFGHFAAAKLSGMRVDIFAIGFGKRLFGWNKKKGFTFGELPEDFDGEGQTDYRLCLLPLGGYVKIAGMVDESFDTEYANAEPQPYEFRSKSVPKKVLVISAGVIMNFLLTFFIFWGINFFQGKQVTDTTVISYVDPATPAGKVGFQTNDKVVSVNGKEVSTWDEINEALLHNTIGDDLKFTVLRNDSKQEVFVPRNTISDTARSLFLYAKGMKPVAADIVKDSPAEKAGLKPGDIYLTLNGEEIYTTEQAISYVSSHKEQQMNLTVLRVDENEKKDTVTVAITPGKDGKIGTYLGVTYLGGTTFRKFGVFESVGKSWNDIVKMTNLTFSMFGKVIGGDVAFGKAFGGPIKIAKYAAKSADVGIMSFLYFLAMLSLSLAILNILPFPVLDGGHLVIILIEGAIKREIPIKIKMGVQKVGFALLLILMVFILYNDIINP